MKNKSFVLFLLSILFFSSCSRNLLYLSDLPLDKITKIPRADTNYRLKPYDYLQITITTPDEKLNKLFQAYFHAQRAQINQGQYSSYYLTGIMVNDSGYIALPFIDTIRAQGKTVNQVQDIIQQKVNAMVKDAMVRVKLISFEVFFIGEINGSQLFYKDKVNILEAISQAGGIPYSGDKKHVFVIRPQDSTYQIYTLDLTSKNILKNRDFILQPGDIIYIRPRKTQIFRMQVQDYYFLVSLFSTTVSLITLILTLKK